MAYSASGSSSLGNADQQNFSGFGAVTIGDNSSGGGLGKAVLPLAIAGIFLAAIIAVVWLKRKD